MKVLVKGIEILIDKWNLDLIRDYSWCRSNNYLQARVNGKQQLLHRMIAERMGLDLSNQIDHIDRDTSNNQESNLRSATCLQNNMNSGKQKNNTSGYKGVCKHRKKWQAQIRYQKKLIQLGTFDDKENAARAYDKAALKHFGEFACLNFSELKLNYYLSFLFSS